MPAREGRRRRKLLLEQKEQQIAVLLNKRDEVNNFMGHFVDVLIVPLGSLLDKNTGIQR